MGTINPLLKKGDKAVCDNYRGIMLLSVIYKIFSGLLYKYLKDEIDKNIGDYQRGFRSVKFTIHQIFVLAIAKYQEQN